MLKNKSLVRVLDIRFITLIGVGLVTSACSQGYHKTANPELDYQGHSDAYYHHTPQQTSDYATHYTPPQHVGYNTHQPSYDYSEYQQPAYSQMSYSHDTDSAEMQAVDIYPIGCGTVDVSNCDEYSVSSNSYDETPKLRGRAKKNTYASIGAGTLDIDRGVYKGVIRAGVDGGYLGLEVEGSKSFKSDTWTPIAGTEQSLGLNYSVAGFGVVRVPLWNRFKALGRFGYHFSEYEQTLTTGTTTLVAKQKSNDLAYGGGIEFDVTHKDSLRVDYTGYETDFIGRTDSVTASYLRRF